MLVGIQNYLVDVWMKMLPVLLPMTQSMVVVDKEEEEEEENKKGQHVQCHCSCLQYNGTLGLTVCRVFRDLEPESLPLYAVLTDLVPIFAGSVISRRHCVTYIYK